jgi:hypothetical protein
LDETILPKDFMFYSNLPVTIDKQVFYFSFVEVEDKKVKTDRTNNVIEGVLNLAFDTEDFSHDIDISETYYLYVAISVRDEEGFNVLDVKNKNYDSIIIYLEKLRQNYCSTNNKYHRMFLK